MQKILLKSVIDSSPHFSFNADEEIKNALAEFDKKVIVLDDDPTGVQTVFDIPVYTAWDRESIENGFADSGMFFVLTNSRGLSADAAKRLNIDIAENIFSVSQASGKDFVLISRSDSTLRGHYPLETMTLRKTLEKSGSRRFDGEIICPFFIEGGRYTYRNTHYVLYGEELIPSGDTEFARDKSFGYQSSDLRYWVEEKTGGAYSNSDVTSVSLETIRTGGPGAVAEILNGVSGFGKVIVNALCYEDIKLFLAGYIKSVIGGKNFIFRSAAAIPKILGGVPDRPLLQKEQLTDNGCNGGLVVIGSHVEKTTKQLEVLKNNTEISAVEFNQHLALDKQAFSAELERIKTLVNELIGSGKDVVVYTRRDRMDMNTGNANDELNLSRSISDAVAGIVRGLDVRPAYIIAKGGITSSDIGTLGLQVRRAVVAGQILPGVPVWRLGKESRFPGLAYIIFPGNVGGEDALAKVVSSLC